MPAAYTQVREAITDKVRQRLHTIISAASAAPARQVLGSPGAFSSYQLFCCLWIQFKEYLARAEYLKGVSGQDSGGPENGNVTAAQKVRKPGVGGKDDVSHEWHGRGCNRS